MSHRYVIDERTRVVTLHNMAVPVLLRVNSGNVNGDAKDIFWGHSDDNRFSLPGIKQTYLATGLDAISEATPWRMFLYNGFDSGTDGNVPLPTPGEDIVCDQSELEPYFVSYIIPNQPLRLLDFVYENPAIYRAHPQVWCDENLQYAKSFSEQLLAVADKLEIDGIYYRSKFSTFGQNIYVTERAKNKLTEETVILRRSLLKVLEPLRREISHVLRVRW